MAQKIPRTPTGVGSRGNDNVLWAAFGWMKYYQFWAAGEGSGTNVAFLLSSAKGFLDTVASTISSNPCPGGVLWKPGGDSENTITNMRYSSSQAQCTTSSLERLATVRKPRAFRIGWQQMETKHRRVFTTTDPPPLPTPVVQEMLRQNLYTYNTGQMLGAAGALYTATSNKDYLTAGNATLNALVTSTDLNRNGVLFENTCDASACTNNDNSWSFKGITMEGAQYVLDAANDPAFTSLYSPWIGFQAASIKTLSRAVAMLVMSGIRRERKNTGTVKVPPGAGKCRQWRQWRPLAALGGKIPWPQKYNSATLGMAISAGNAALKYGANDRTFTC
ncbi:hypothetical protein K438DRAFT_1988794 [Mycena galopus ATCC 62051]|nr:hypothetical protein K438DRAFT_1988794 [Mycena galopus ATCC 62051]